MEKFLKIVGKALCLLGEHKGEVRSGKWYNPAITTYPNCIRCGKSKTMKF